MARPLKAKDNIDFSTQQKVEYPWHEWLDGRTWEAVQGEDFYVTPRNFSANLHVTARRKGMEVTIRSLGNGHVRFRFRKATS